MTDLSQDELTVLLIAAKGESMIPIGKWGKAIKDLAARGLMRATDDANYFITEAGRKAQVDTEDADIRAMIVTNNRVVEAKQTAVLENRDVQLSRSIEQAALHPSFAIKTAQKVPGARPDRAAGQVIFEVVRRARDSADAGD